MSLAYADVTNLSYAQASAELRQHFSDQWPVRSGGAGVVPIAWQNGPKLDPPPNAKAGDCYVEFEIFYTGVRRNVLGGTGVTAGHERRSTGRILVSAFVPRKLGTGKAEGFVDQISDIWATARVNGLPGSIVLYGTRPVPQGNHPSVPFWSLAAMTTFSVQYVG